MRLICRLGERGKKCAMVQLIKLKNINFTSSLAGPDQG